MVVPTRVARETAQGRRYVDDRSDMASGYANTRLSGRRFNGEGTGSGTP